MAEVMSRRLVWLPLESGGVRSGWPTMRLMFVLEGPAGAASFTVDTGWERGDWQQRQAGRLSFPAIHQPEGTDLGIHSRTARPGLMAIGNNCLALTGGGPCWYDGISLPAMDLFSRFVSEGEAVVWAALADSYAALLSDPEG